jgi:hypothetical protein
LQPLELNCHFQVQSLEFPQDGWYSLLPP